MEFGTLEHGTVHHGPIPLPNQTKNLLFHFDDGQIIRGKKTLFSSKELKLYSGEWLTITGKNGAGKTSLLEAMLQLIKYEGDMFYRDQLLSKIKQAAKHMYLVYQNPELQFITNSVYDEVYIHYNHLDPKHANDETMDLLKLLHLDQVKDHHPFEISTGQKRRLSVATALSSKAEIILLDEPTFGLDSHNTFQLIKLFQERVNQGQTIIMVTHDPEIIKRYPTRRLRVEDGCLKEMEGEHIV